MCSYLPTRFGLRDVGEKWNSQFGCLGRPIGVARASPMLPGVCVGVFRSLDDVAMDGALPRIRTESSAHMDPHVMVISCQLSRRVENQKKEYRKPKNPEPRTRNPEPITQQPDARRSDAFALQRLIPLAGVFGAGPTFGFAAWESDVDVVRAIVTDEDLPSGVSDVRPFEIVGNRWEQLEAEGSSIDFRPQLAKDALGVLGVLITEELNEHDALLVTERKSSVFDHVVAAQLIPIPVDPRTAIVQPTGREGQGNNHQDTQSFHEHLMRPRKFEPTLLLGFIRQPRAPTGGL